MKNEMKVSEKQNRRESTLQSGREDEMKREVHHNEVEEKVQ